MLKRNLLVALVLLVCIVVVGCGVSQEEHDAVLAERNAARAEVASLQSDLAKMQSDLSDAESQFEGAQSHLESTRKEQLAAESQISSLQSQLESTRKELSAAESQKSSLHSQISSLQSQLAGAKAKVAELEELIATLVPTYKWHVYTDGLPFRDTRLQKAICLILDEEEIARQALPGKNVRFEPEQEWASGENDLLIADRLMREAGYPNGFYLNIYYAPMMDEGIKDLVAAVKTSLSAAGIHDRLFPIATIEALPKADFVLIVKRVE